MGASPASTRARTTAAVLDTARRSYNDARAAQENAVAQLRLARDPLVVLGAPQPGPDLAESRQQLTSWADSQCSETDVLLVAAREQAQKGADAFATTQRELETASEAETTARKAHAAKDRTAFGARATLELLLEAVATLRARLATADAPGVVDAQLQRLDELDAAAKAASATQNMAHEQARVARRHSEQLNAQVTAGIWRPPATRSSLSAPQRSMADCWRAGPPSSAGRTARPPSAAQRWLPRKASAPQVPSGSPRRPAS